ncbi:MULTISPECIES: sigma-70 family RNA polymerase sigma factor [unclassified Luteococcus]|uniref:sigma-70 family RNA polymerase sigma factor n=1 Tax=unclassified Luteococcus TaxID=2639923 RepID=UPI00313ECDF7
MSCHAMDTTYLPELLTADQEVQLGDRIEAGVLAAAVLDGREPWPAGATETELRALVGLGEQAWEHFLLANLRLVIHHAARASRRTEVSFDELFQEGCVGLASALERFDHRQGVKFSTYGQPWVRNAVLQHAVTRGGQLEGPVWRNRQAHRLRSRLAELEGELGRREAVRVLAAEFGHDQDWVRATLSAGSRVPLELVEFSEVISCPRAARELAACEEAEPDWLDRLGSQEATVIGLLYGLGEHQRCDYRQVADQLGVSVSTVRRLERRGLDQARDLLTGAQSVGQAA